MGKTPKLSKWPENRQRKQKQNRKRGHGEHEDGIVSTCFQQEQSYTKNADTRRRAISELNSKGFGRQMVTNFRNINLKLDILHLVPVNPLLDPEIIVLKIELQKSILFGRIAWYSHWTNLGQLEVRLIVLSSRPSRPPHFFFVTPQKKSTTNYSNNLKLVCSFSIINGILWCPNFMSEVLEFPVNRMRGICVACTHFFNETNMIH